MRLTIGPTPILIALLVVSGGAGLFVPGFYEWTDSDQSRPSPLLWQIPAAWFVAGLLFCAALPWLPLAGWKNDQNQAFRFSIRSGLLITAVIASVVAAAQFVPLAVGIGCWSIAIAASVWMAIRFRERTVAVVATLCCIYGPFLWLFSFEQTDAFESPTMMLAGIPGVMGQALLASAFGGTLHDSTWLALVVTAFEILAGLGMVRLGPKWAIGYVLTISALSLFSSIGLNAAMRA